MLYNRLDNDELERAVYIDPTNTAARAELLSRIPALMDTRTEQAEDLAMALDLARKDHAAEIEELEQQLKETESDAQQRQRDLTRENDDAAAALQIARNERDQALRRVEQLTRSADLV